MIKTFPSFYLGDSVEIAMLPDCKVFTGILTNWDDIAIYINGLGFPREDILDLNPL